MSTGSNIVRLLIPSSEDREHMLVALGNSGYKVWIEYVDRFTWKSKSFVCFENKGTD